MDSLEKNNKQMLKLFNCLYSNLHLLYLTFNKWYLFIPASRSLKNVMYFRTLNYQMNLNIGLCLAHGIKICKFSFHFSYITSA